MLSGNGHYIIPQSQFWHQATQLSTANEHFISDLDFPNNHFIFSFILTRALNLTFRQPKFKGFRYQCRDTLSPDEEKNHLHWRLWCAEERKLILKISKELTMHFLPRLCFAPCASSSTLDPPELMGE